jgi:nitrogen-specific signal transduction histidine kinase
MVPEKEAYYLNLAQEEVQRLIHIVQRTLDFYRPSHGRTTLTDVNNVIESVLALANKSGAREGACTAACRPICRS